MVVETNDGYITKNNIYDIYSADHKLAEKLLPPSEILPANKEWFMRDSNYSGHFPLSAERAAWFLEKEQGPGVDSVMAIDQTFVTELLRLTGPIKIPELSQPLTAENFSTIVSYVVESKLTGREDPKAILKSFMPIFIQALFKKPILWLFCLFSAPPPNKSIFWLIQRIRAWSFLATPLLRRFNEGT